MAGDANVIKSAQKSGPKDVDHILSNNEFTGESAMKEVQEAWTKRQAAPIPDAAKDGLGKDSAMSDQLKTQQNKEADNILKGAAVVGATASDKTYSPAAVMAADAKVFGKKSNAA
jgi:hypothetical protein